MKTLLTLPVPQLNPQWLPSPAYLHCPHVFLPKFVFTAPQAQAAESVGWGPGCHRVCHAVLRATSGRHRSGLESLLQLLCFSPACNLLWIQVQTCFTRSSLPAPWDHSSLATPGLVPQLGLCCLGCALTASVSHKSGEGSNHGAQVPLCHYGPQLRFSVPWKWSL